MNAQQNFRVSGFVKDKTSGESLIGANIIQQGTTRGTMTDYNGYFSIPVSHPCSLTLTFLGYKSSLLTLNIRKDTLINVFLVPGIEELSEVTISAPRRRDFNVTTLDYSQMTKIPSLGGKPDVIKALQLMPGITSQSEGTSLMLVRGGDPGQNLYLFDNTPVIYVNHLGGFTSVFNPDIINNIDVYKGGFPSKYGGKLSSVTDITQREGNASELRGSYSIGITDASFTLEGPVKREKASFIVTGRKTLIDPVMALMTRSSEANNFILLYGFHDINGKLTWKPKENNSYSLNVYQGDDYLNYWSKKDNKTHEKHHLGHTWGNLLVSLQHKSALSPRLYFGSSLSLTRYRLRETMKYSFNDSDTSEARWKYKSVVQDVSYKTALKYNLSRDWLTELGLQVSYLRFKPNDTYYTDHTILQSPDVINSMENAFYMDNKISFSKNSWIAPGFRIVNYIAKDYAGFSFEPRLNVTAGITPNHSLNASFMKVTQFSHLIFTAGDIMNNEVWIPAGKKIAPAGSEQYTIGWKGDYMKGKFSSEVNVYYKNMYNLSTFREGYTSLAGDNSWISKVESEGKGKSGGIEFMVKKNTGKWSGFAGYAFSRATRQYPNINKGQEYIFDYDRPHSFTLNLDHNITNNLNLNLAWIYQTGLPYTAAIGRQYLPPLEENWDGNKYYYEALVYGERNAGRMRDYHRLDIGLNWSTLTRKRGNRAEWNFSIYNAYNRHNPVYYYYNNNNSEEIFNPETAGEFKPLSLYQRSLFPVIPSISYKVFFSHNNSVSWEKPEKTRIPFKVKFRNWLYHKI